MIAIGDLMMSALQVNNTHAAQPVIQIQSTHSKIYL